MGKPQHGFVPLGPCAPGADRVVSRQSGTEGRDGTAETAGHEESGGRAGWRRRDREARCDTRPVDGELGTARTRDLGCSQQSSDGSAELLLGQSRVELAVKDARYTISVDEGIWLGIPLGPIQVECE